MDPITAALSTPPPFHPFSGEHYATLVIGVVAAVGFVVAGKKGGTAERLATGLLATCCLLAVPFSVLAWLTVKAPTSVENFLPLQMCDLAALAAGFALLTGRPWLCALTYFWGLAATLQGLLTPAITVGFPELVFVVFFMQHFAVVIAAFYLPIVQGWRPKSPLWRAPLEIFGFSVIYLAFILAVNSLIGSNYAFVSRPPSNPSLIDHLGPWPWYVLSLLGLALALFYLLVLPFVRFRRAS